MSEEIKQVLEGLLSSINTENENEYKSVQESDDFQKARESINNNDINGFYYSLVYPFQNQVRGLLTTELPKLHQAQFLFQQCEFVECNIKRFFENIEGSACCADKTRTIMHQLLVFFKTGKEIVFNYEQEYTYHLPTKVLNNHTEVVDYFMALYRLYYGQSKEYIAMMNDFNTRFITID